MAIPPESIRRGAQKRLHDTLEEQAMVEDAVRKRRPLDAEPDRERCVKYVAKMVGVDRKIAEKIADYADPDTLPLSPAQRSAAESIQGNTIDFLPISFIELAQAAAESVARIAYRSREPQGTGFLVSPSLLLTNQHVLANAAAAKSFVAEFRYQLDPFLNHVAISRFALDPDRFYLSSPEAEFDFALVAVGPRFEGGADLADFGFLPLSSADDKHVLGGLVNILQHPAGRPKEVVIRENRVFARTATTLIYGADTLPGSSGSVVLNDRWEAVALHHYGSPYRARRDPDAATVPNYGNEGIRISAILERLGELLKKQTGERAKLLEEALACKFSSPSLIDLRFQRRVEEAAAGGAVAPPALRGKAAGGRTFVEGVRVEPDGTAVWTLPLTVAVRLGGVAAPPAQVEARVETEKEQEPEEEKGPPPARAEEPEGPGAEAKLFVPDQNYGRRRGYSASFLGIPVPLPRLSAAQRRVAARNLRAREGDDPFELKYQHFSLVLNGARRLAFFTAVNIDGASVVKYDRKTGAVTRGPEGLAPESAESAEAYETWYADERVEPEKVSDQSLYDGAELRGFQRGHLVKRTDPSWGTEERAYRGQSDTYHFTNCSPQRKGFNDSRTAWLGLESWIEKQSDDENFRVSVFSGPVFRRNDPRRGYVQVPRQYWKVAAWVEDGELRSLALRASQAHLIERLPEAAEAFDEVPEKLEEYQSTVAEIEELTGLDFGELRDRDVFAGGAESLGARRLEGVEDLRIR